jgi:NAD(P)-dependent dehydrogenase (short-subunit alcohol dehydrogenase family)
VPSNIRFVPKSTDGRRSHPSTSRYTAVLFAREGADVAIVYLPEKEDSDQIPPTKRPAQPEEIAPAFVFFASNTDWSY